MNKPIFLLALLTLFAFNIQAQVLSQFDWEGASKHSALVGPDASSSGSYSTRKATGNGSPNGLAPGCNTSGFCGFAGGCASNSCRQDIDFYVEHTSDATYFNTSGVDIQIDFRAVNDENAANFFVRGEGVRFGSDCCGIVYIGYRVDDGGGGFTQKGSPLFGTNGFELGSPGETFTNTDHAASAWHTYRFVYDPTTGVGEVFRDGVSYWSDFGIPGRNIYWTGAPNGWTIGQRTDGQGSDATTYDNAIIQDPVVLPVTLTSFEGQRQNESVLLEWETGSESNNHYYEILRTIGNEEPVKIGEVEAVGNSTAPSSYSFVDPFPRNGSNKYILRQYDLNGENRSIGMTEITFEGSGSEVLDLYPNPTATGTNINVKYESNQDRSLTFEVLDLQGRKLHTQYESVNGGVSRIEVNTSSLSDGIYLLLIKDNVRVTTKRFVIRN